MKNTVCLSAAVLVAISSTAALYAQLDPQQVSMEGRRSEAWAKVLQGPESNVIYLRLWSGDVRITEPAARHEYWQDDEVSVQMQAFPSILSPGNPVLPYRVCLLALPPDADASTLTLEVTRVVEEQVAQLHKIGPAPPHAICQDSRGSPPPEEEFYLSDSERWGPGKEIVNGHNMLVYDKDALFPAANCRATYAGQLRKWKVVTVTFHPVRYNPAESRLLWTREIDLKIRFQRDGNFAKHPPAMALLRDDAFDSRAREVLLNFDHARKWYREILVTDAERDAGKESAAAVSQFDFAVITTNETFSATTIAEDGVLDEFCFHKEDLGFEVIVVTEDQVWSVEGDTVTGYSFALVTGLRGYDDVEDADVPDETPDRLRKWLQDNFATLGLEYVLLIGNPDPNNAQPDDLVGDLPMKDCQLHLSSDVPTDFYFAELTGDWDLDDDGLAGEYYDSSGEDVYTPSGITDKTSFSVVWSGAIEVAFPTTRTTLTADVGVGGTVLQVADTSGLAFDQLVRVGTPGAPETETTRVRIVRPDELRVDALSNAHPAGTEVELVAGLVRLVFTTEGNTQVWLDEGLDGIDDNDLIVTLQPEHRPYKEPAYDVALPVGRYPIRIEYAQTIGDAYFRGRLIRFTSAVDTAFQHDDGTGNYQAGLDADFFDNETFSGSPIPETSGFPFVTSNFFIELRYAAAGDLGPGGVEFLPELIVGRIPVYDQTGDGIPDYEDVNSILEKVIAYETADVHSQPWRRGVLTSCPYVADSNDPDPANDVAVYEWSEMLRNDVASPPLWNWHRIYEQTYPDVVPDAEVSDGCSYEQTQAGWNDPVDPDDGRGVVTWMSHGDKTSARDVFGAFQCSSLDDEKPSMVFMGACFNGEPEFVDYWGRGAVPLGHANLIQGAIATVSATRESFG